MTEILTYLPTFALSLTLTLALEFAVALAFRLRGRDIALFALVNVLTNPAAVYLHLLFRGICPDGFALAWQIPIEAAVVAVEGILYSRLSRSIDRPWAFAVLANAFSYGTGLILNIIL